MDTQRASVVRGDALRVVEKVWGREIWLQPDGGAVAGYCGKILRVENGAAGSLHYHPRKAETMLVVQGRISVEADVDPVPVGSTHLSEPSRWRFVLDEGDTLTLPAGVPHRIAAVDGDATLFEVSTPHDDDDVVRLEPSRPARL